MVPLGEVVHGTAEGFKKCPSQGRKENSWIQGSQSWEKLLINLSIRSHSQSTLSESLLCAFAKHWGHGDE